MEAESDEDRDLKEMRSRKSQMCIFFLMIRRPPSSTQSGSSAASDVDERQHVGVGEEDGRREFEKKSHTLELQELGGFLRHLYR